MKSIIFTTLLFSIILISAANAAQLRKEPNAAIPDKEDASRILNKDLPHSSKPLNF